MVGICLLLCLVIGAAAIGTVQRRIDFGKMLVMDVSGFFFLYTLVSGCFFWADAFDMTAVMAVCLCIEVIALIVFALLSGRKGMTGCLFSFPVKTVLIPVIVSLLVLPFTWQKFELYSMGQDQGTYQVKALQLLSGDTHNRIEMTEYRNLRTPEDRQRYLDFVYSQNNLYLPHVIEETVEDASQFDVITGTIHGYPTFGAILALWATIFGYAHMIGVQTVLYLCLIFATFYLARGLRLSPMISGAAALLSAAGPGVLWGSKSSLTEVFLALMMTLFLLGVTDGRGGDADGADALFSVRCLSFIPLAAFSFLHVSIYVFMPAIVCVYLLFWFAYRDRGDLFALIGALVTFYAGTLFGFSAAPYYTYGNYSPIYKLLGDRLSNDSIIPFLSICVAAGILLALFFLCKKGARFTETVAARYTKSAMPERIAVIGIRLFLIAAAFLFVYKGVLKAESLRDAEYLQISAYVYMSGIVVVPLLYLGIFVLTKRFLQSAVMALFTGLFLYCVVAYSLFMRFTLQFYYYYARYVTLFIPMLFVFFFYAACRLELLGKQGVRIALGLGAVALVSFLPYDIGLRTQQDHTRCHWDYLDELCKHVSDKDALIVGPDEQQILFVFPIRFLTHCDVYPPADDLRAQIESLSGSYEHVLYLDYNGVMDDLVAADPAWTGGTISGEEVFEGENHLSYLDYFHINTRLTPIPLTYVEYTLDMSLYAWEGKNHG